MSRLAPAGFWPMGLAICWTLATSSAGLACPAESPLDCKLLGTCDIVGCRPSAGIGSGGGASGGPGGGPGGGKGPNIMSIFATGSPVSARNGKFMYQETDLHVDAPGLPFAFTRQYNSQSGVLGPFGWGWSHSYHWPLSVQGDGSVQVLTPQLEPVVFLPNGNGTYRPALPSQGYELTTSTAGHYILHKDKLTYAFNGDRKLTTISDAFGHTTSLAYSAQTSDPVWGHLLTTITDSVSRTYTVTWAAYSEHSIDSEVPVYGLTQLTETATGRTISYDVVAGELLMLTSVVDSAYGGGLCTSYLYSLSVPTYNLLAVVDRAIRVRYELTYDAADGVATYKEGVEPVVAYSRNPTESYTIATKAGSTKRIEYTTTNQLLREVDYDGTVTTLTWDEDFHHPVRRDIADPRGYTTTILYDTSCGCGDLRPLSITDAQGGVTTFTYDERKNLASKIDPLERTTAYQWNATDQLLSETDALSGTTSYTYNALGLVATKTDPVNGVTSYGYDVFGRLTGTTNPAGGVTQLAVNAAGFVTSRTSPGGSVDTYTRDAAGRILAHSNPAGAVTTYSYDGGDRVLTETTARGHKTTYLWSGPGGALGRVELPLVVHQFQHDAYGNVTDDDADPYLTHEFDDWHRLKVTRRNGGINGAIVYSHDAVGNTTGVREIAGPLEGSPYTASGPLTRYTHDGLNRVTGVLYPDGGAITRTYDAAGNVTLESDSAGNVTTFAYDVLNRPVRRTAPMGRVTEWGYDGLGRKLSESDPAGHVTTFGYDVLGRLAGTSNPMTHVTTFSHTVDGDLAGIRDARGNVWTFGYDAAHRLVSESTPLSHVTTYSYDLDGNPSGKTDARGQVTVSVFDANQRLSSVTAAGVSQVSYSYGVVYPGEVISVTAPGYAMSQSWTHGRVTQQLYSSQGTAQAEVNHAYDDARRKKKVWWREHGGGTGPFTQYVRDAMGRVTHLTESAHGSGAPIRTTTYTYGVRGERLSVSRPNGVVTTSAYNAAGDVTSIRHRSGSGQTIGSFAYQYSAEGLRVGRTTPAGQETYGYDSAHRLTSSTSATEAETFAYDAVGNLEGISNAAGVRLFAHDASNRLVSEGGATPATYVFDANGNQTKRTAASEVREYVWDPRDKLKAVSVNGTTVCTFDYHPLSDRMRTRHVPGEERRATFWDGENPLFDARMAAGSAVLAPERYYALLDGYDEVESMADMSATTIFYPLRDALLSTRHLTDTTGSVAAAYGYSAYGEQRGWTDPGASLSRFAHTGREWDASAGAYYYRARWYQPEKGRFTSREPFPKWLYAGPIGLTRYAWSPSTTSDYLYVAGDPTYYRDPNGYCPILVVLVPILCGITGCAPPIESKELEKAKDKVDDKIDDAMKDLSHSGPDGIKDSSKKLDDALKKKLFPANKDSK